MIPGHARRGPGLLDREHHRDDRAGSGQQRGSERDHGHVDAGVGHRLLLLPGEQLEGDEEEEQAAGALERGE